MHRLTGCLQCGRTTDDTRLQNSEWRYGAVAMAIHWLIAFLVIAKK
jgi:hypothetical protein